MTAAIDHDQPLPLFEILTVRQRTGRHGVYHDDALLQRIEEGR